MREWPLFFILGCIIFMLYPMLHADFGMIDDHEIVSILGKDNKVTIPELFPLIKQWAIEHDGRFRPGYYTLRIFEAFLVGGNAVRWYANRLLLAIVSATALYCGLRVVLTPFSAGVVALLFFSGPQNEIWTRLGPQETYAVPLTLMGLAWILIQLGHHNSQPTRLFPGLAALLLTGFIKESFIPVLPGVLAFVYIVMPSMLPSSIPSRQRLELVDLLILLFLVIGIGVQAWLTIKMLYTYGHLHSAEISLRSLFEVIKPSLESYSKNTLWFVPLIAGLISLVPGTLEDWREQSWRQELVKAIVLVATGGFLILVPQWLVYGGSPHAGRYLTPGNLFVVLAAALGFYLMSSNFAKRRTAELRGFVAGMLITLALFRVLGTYRDADAAALLTNKFQSKVAEIVELKRQHPELPLLFYSTSISDREPLVSVASFLAAKLPIEERPFLNPFDWESGADSEAKRRVAKLIRDESVEGDQYFAKIRDFHSGNGRCIAVMFSAISEPIRCNYSVPLYDL